MFKKLTKPYVIAEISGNHNGSIERAKLLIKLAKENGADCVKLQTYSPDTMTIKCDKEDFMINGGLWDGYNLWDLYNWAQTPFDWQKPLFDYANEIGITCISTPFDETAVDLLEELNCPFYKVASFELTDHSLIKYIAEKKKPMILSTGMANEKEIMDAIAVVKKYGSGEFIILHCVSGYPTPTDQINLNTISLLKEKFDVEVGLSDHTLGNTSAILSIAYGVKVIEKHFTFDRSEGGPDAEFSMEPVELNELCKNLLDASKALGTQSFEKRDAEKENVKFRRSIYVTKPIKKGEKFSKDNIRRIRPGFGLSPKYYELLIGSKAIKDLSYGTPLKEEHIEADILSKE
ncbi:pseudaminic acid synthase [Gammaproteobacteria bacterium]|nr:pseudaminic acid synthase [Gammaproteobacteria bacterium]